MVTLYIISGNIQKVSKGVKSIISNLVLMFNVLSYMCLFKVKHIYCYCQVIVNILFSENLSTVHPAVLSDRFTSFCILSITSFRWSIKHQLLLRDTSTWIVCVNSCNGVWVARESQAEVELGEVVWCALVMCQKEPERKIL